MKSHPTAAIFLAVLCAACARDPQERGEAQNPATPGAFPDSAPTGNESPFAMAQRHFAQVPDSVLMRRGACPFECCVYGDWRAETEIPVLTGARRDASAAYALKPGDPFVADSGHVRILGPAIIVVTDTVRAEDRVMFVPGDTLVVLDYIGEGYWNLWHEGREIREVQGFWGAEMQNPRGAYYGDYHKEWWVHVRAPGEGWFRADSTYRFSGADACGVP